MMDRPTEQSIAVDAKEYVTGLHWVIFRYALLMAFVAIVIFGYLTQFKVPGVVVVIIATGMWAEALLRYMNIRFTVQDKIVEIKMSIFSPAGYAIVLKDIHSVEIVQSLIARWLNYGHVIIRYQADEGEDYVTLPYVAAPTEFKRRLGK